MPPPQLAQAHARPSSPTPARSPTGCTGQLSPSPARGVTSVAPPELGGGWEPGGTSCDTGRSGAEIEPPPTAEPQAVASPAATIAIAIARLMSPTTAPARRWCPYPALPHPTP